MIGAAEAKPDAHKNSIPAAMAATRAGRRPETKPPIATETLLHFTTREKQKRRSYPTECSARPPSERRPGKTPARVDRTRGFCRSFGGFATKNAGHAKGDTQNIRGRTTMAFRRRLTRIFWVSPLDAPAFSDGAGAWCRCL